MSKVTMYHNPACSKSRQTLALLEDRGINPEIVEYLVTPPDARTLTSLLGKLGMKAQDLLRKGEPEFSDLALEGQSEEAIVAAMVNTPKLIERPIVEYGDKAALGRPPEQVLVMLGLD